jgi:hypothetical protein
MGNISLFFNILLMCCVQTLLGTPKTPIVFTLKRTSSTFLTQKPVYPPMCKRTNNSENSENKGENRVVVLESKVMLLEAQVSRLQNTLSSVLHVLQTCDDTSLLEKQTCSSLVYNEALTQQRPLRLLRSELKLLQDKFK